jgi:hypothetical protein
MDNFVVYAYCREDGTFYYIGKGRPRRPYGKRKWGINPPKDKDRILILHSGLAETIALDYEEKLILFYGRKDLGTGLLRNMTNGGEGVSGWIPNEGWRKKKKESMTGESNPFYGKTHTEEQILKIKEKRKGKCVGEDNYFFGVHLIGELNPMYGKERPDLAQRNKDNPAARGTKWYNNGEIDKRFHPDNVPEGFVPGRLNMGRKSPKSSLPEG